MTEIEMNTEAEHEDLAGDLFDEALDRTEGDFAFGGCGIFDPPAGW